MHDILVMKAKKGKLIFELLLFCMHFCLASFILDHSVVCLDLCFISCFIGSSYHRRQCSGWEEKKRRFEAVYRPQPLYWAGMIESLGRLEP